MLIRVFEGNDWAEDRGRRKQHVEKFQHFYSRQTRDGNQMTEEEMRRVVRYVRNGHKINGNNQMTAFEMDIDGL